VLAAGRRLGVMILSSDRDHSIRPSPGTELTMDLKESKLRLPIVGGPSTFTNAFDWDE
jgi:X-Pro dipeptidyl-peptidase